MAYVSEADFTNVNLSNTFIEHVNLKGVNLSGANLEDATLIRVNISGAILNNINFRRRNLIGAFNEADLNEVYIFDNSLVCHCMSPIRDKREFFEVLLSWKNKYIFEKSILLYRKFLIPGIFLYTEEDEQLSLYIKSNFEALDQLTGDWCNIYILETPPFEWRNSYRYWKEIIEVNLFNKIKILNWFRTRAYNKSEVYAIARELNIDINKIPCFVLLNPDNLSENLIFTIREISPAYFRDLFSYLEKIVQSTNYQTLFNEIKTKFKFIIKRLEKYSEKEKRVEQRGLLQQTINLQNAQFAGGFVNAEVVQSHQIGVTTCNTNRSNLQSRHFQTRINCNYNYASARINCN